MDIFFPAVAEVDSDSNPPPTHAQSDITITALTATLQDLKEQRQQMDISIQVLTRRLQHLLNTHPHSQRHHDH